MAEPKAKGSATARLRLASATHVPDFETEAEAAQWYDTHDTSKLPGEPVPAADMGVRAPTLETIAVRVSAHEVEELKRRAARLGIGYTTYVRMLITRHVLTEAPIG